MEKLKKAIENWLKGDTPKKKSAAKGVITRIIHERVKEIGAPKTREEALNVLATFNEIPECEWLQNRFALNSMYEDNGRVWGWWDASEQAQAEELPFSPTDSYYVVSFYGRENEALWRERGFERAERLPIRFGYRNGLYVEFEIERSTIFLKHGYALPCQLQWDRSDECYRVTRSIISEGFWQAWKWYEGSKWWYLEHRPELFSDMDWWGSESVSESVNSDPVPDSSLAVLGGNNKSYWEAKRIPGIVTYLDS